MEHVIDLTYEIGHGQIILKLQTPSGTHELKGFEVLLKEHLWKVLESDFEDSELFFRDQPYQKLTMSKKDDILDLKIDYPDNDMKDVEMKVNKPEFEEFLQNINNDLKD